MATAQMYTAAQLILQGLGVKPTPVGINLLVAWMSEEDGDTSTLPCKNPMNSTLVEPGSHSVNGVGVQCYTSWSSGISATLKTLQNGLYNTLVQAIKTGNASLFFGTTGRGELGTWSTGQYGGAPWYGNQIYSIYTSLPSPPSQYLTGASTAASSTPVITVSVTNPLWDLVLIGSGLALGIAGAKLLVFEEGRLKWKSR